MRKSKIQTSDVTSPCCAREKARSLGQIRCHIPFRLSSSRGLDSASIPPRCVHSASMNRLRDDSDVVSVVGQDYQIQRTVPPQLYSPSCSAVALLSRLSTSKNGFFVTTMIDRHANSINQSINQSISQSCVAFPHYWIEQNALGRMR